MAKSGMASCLVLVSRPGSHWQAPIGVLQNVCNAACVHKVKIHGAIAQKVSGKGEHRADTIASDIQKVAVKIPLKLNGAAMQKQDA